jgi:hypothetical protein
MALSASLHALRDQLQLNGTTTPPNLAGPAAPQLHWGNGLGEKLKN